MSKTRFNVLQICMSYRKKHHREEALTNEAATLGITELEIVDIDPTEGFEGNDENGDGTSSTQRFPFRRLWGARVGQRGVRAVAPAYTVC